MSTDVSHHQLAREVVTNLLKLLPEQPFVVRLPDGSQLGPEPPEASPRFTLVLNRPAALRRMLLPPSELAMGEAYIFDEFDVEGDIVFAFQFIDELKLPRPSWSDLARLGRQLWQLERAEKRQAAPGAGGNFSPYSPDGMLHSPDRDRQAAQFHYDLSNDFYRLWLDKRLVYSCAYFEEDSEALDSAQEHKLDRICRKLDLRDGERLLDIGCGFGGLMMYAARHYGARVQGISLSERQTEEALARIKEADLGDRCQISICHYEEYEVDQPFDKLVSVGMFEHVGHEKLSGYFSKTFELLKPGGLFLLQGGSARLGRDHVGRGWMDKLGMGRNAFMQKYSFPDSRLIDIPAILLTAERAGFETLDVESLRHHYPITLGHWLARLERNQEAAATLVGEVAYRAWRLVLAGYIHLLEKGKLTEYQTLLARPPLSQSDVRP
jgi:cyclopropane-fatty-acyl-phospholipid synthase